MRKESLWFAGTRGAILIAIASYSFSRCSSPRCRPLGPSRCRSNQLYPYGKVCHSSQYKRPLTESLWWGEKPQAEVRSVTPLLYLPTYPKTQAGGGAKGLALRWSSQTQASGKAGPGRGGVRSACLFRHLSRSGLASGGGVGKAGQDTLIQSSRFS